MKNKILLPVIIISVVFCCFHFCQADGPTFITSNYYGDHKISSPTTWTKENSPYILKANVYVYDTLTIEPGVIIKFEKDYQIQVNKKLIALGTPEDNIVFTSWKDDLFGGDTNNDGDNTSPAPGDWYSIIISGGNGAEFDNVKFLYGSKSENVVGTVTIVSTDDVVIKNSEIRYSAFCGIYLKDTQPVIENNIITDNYTGVLQKNYNTKKIAIIRNNTIENNTYGVQSAGTYPYRQLDASNNWWGDKTGPYYKPAMIAEEPNLDGKGNSVNDGVIFRPWLKKDPRIIRKPVILIPGIGASINLDLMIGGVFSDNWIIFSHTYDGIIEAFKQMGYEEGKDLFICYYDWRNSNRESAEKYLKPLVQKANSINGTSKVNLIAHSMGGLVARNYIQNAGYGNDVDNLILIATPNKGSSDVYPVWEGGYIPRNWENRTMMMAYVDYLRTKKASFNSYKIIHDFIPSVRELMPIYNYIYPKSEPGNIKDYSQMYETNSILESLNEGINELNQKVKVSVISGNGYKTVNNIPVVNSVEEGIWLDGKPEPIDPERNDIGGDGRVLLLSSQIQSMFDDTLNYDHGDVVSKAENIIAQRLKEDLDAVYDSPQINEELGFWVASPVYIEIEAPDGKKISKDINNISLAKYASESKSDGFKMIIIPNPKNGKYKIKLTGNENGEYHIGSEFSDLSGEKNDVSSIVQGEINTGEEKEYTISYDSQDQESPVDNIISADKIPPIIIGTATKKPNANGWYNSDVTIHFEATDESGIKEITPDVILDQNGKDQSAIGTATDNNGNVSSVTISGINIDKIAPEAKILFNKEKQKIDIIGVDNLSEGVVVTIEEQTIDSKPEKKKGIFSWIFDIIKNGKKEKNVVTILSDEAGNKAEINFAKRENNEHFINIFPESISYNGMKTNFSKSLLQYKWLLNWRKDKYILFGSHIGAGDELLESHYLPKRNETWIMQKPRELDDDDNDDDTEKRPAWKKLPGMVVPFIQTEQGKIKIKY